MNAPPMYFDKDGTQLEMMEWAQKFGDADYKRVAMTKLDDGTMISTVWLGLDHSPGEIPPCIFETMVFQYAEDGDRGPLHGEMRRYATEWEARVGHKEIVDEIKRRCK